MTVSLERRNEYFSTRVPSGFRTLVQTLVAAVSQSVGTRVTQAQALEIAIREAIESRKREGVGVDEKKA